VSKTLNMLVAALEADFRHWAGPRCGRFDDLSDREIEVIEDERADVIVDSLSLVAPSVDDDAILDVAGAWLDGGVDEVEERFSDVTEEEWRS